MLLKNKVAVIYGAGGAIGGAVACAFASEGAKVFLSGRKQAPLEAVAKEIRSTGGSVEVAEIDALDEHAEVRDVGNRGRKLWTHPASHESPGSPRLCRRISWRCSRRERHCISAVALWFRAGRI